MLNTFGILSLLWLTVASGQSETGSARHRLLEHLISKYPKQGKLVAPRRDDETSVGVNVSLSAPRILAVDMQRPSVKFSSYLRLTWFDDFLTWKPEDYGDVEMTHIPSDELWVPDIRMWDLTAEPCQWRAVAAVSYTGNVFFVQDCVHEVRCHLDITFFPFDTQHCNFSLESSQHTVDTLNITDFTMGGANKKQNEWIITDVLHSVKLRSYPTSAFGIVRVPAVDVTLSMRHDVPLFAFLLILPAIMLSIMNSVVFLIPTHCESKVELGLTIFVAFSVLLNMLMENVPKSSYNMPYLGYYFTMNAMLIAMSVFCATIIMRVWRKSETDAKMQPWAKKLMLMACKALRLRIPTVLEEQKTQGQNTLEQNAAIKAHLDLSMERDLRKKEWILLARLFDRFFFLVYLVVNVIGSVAIFCQLEDDTYTL